MKNDMTFDDLGLGPELLKTIKDVGYVTPTPIQALAIPGILMSRDVLGLAQTGTGKTASFTLPMIEILSGGRAKARMPRSLILTPTRELAAQVADNFDQYGKNHNLTKALLVGGTSMNAQIKKLEQGVDVLIATPGRLLDLFKRGNILLADIKIFVIDEADRMMDMGFIPDLEWIADKLPPLRQTLFFSATMPPAIKKLSEQFLQNPKVVTVAKQGDSAKTVTQYVMDVSPKTKVNVLCDLLKSEKVKNAFIFCNRKRDIAGVKSKLLKAGFKAGEMHGGLNQAERTQTLADFKKGELDLLVCSDVAARGIDVQGLSHVFNYDVPMQAEDYVHRIGRTGRAGEKGTSFTLCTPHDKKFLDAIEKLLKKKIDVFALKGKKAESSNNASAKASTKPSTKTPVKDQNKDLAPVKDQTSNAENADIEQQRQKNRDIQNKRRGSGQQSEKEPLGFGDEMPAFFK